MARNAPLPDADDVREEGPGDVQALQGPSSLGGDSLLTMDQPESQAEELQASSAQQVLRSCALLPWHCTLAAAATGLRDLVSGSCLLCAWLAGFQCVSQVQECDRTQPDEELWASAAQGDSSKISDALPGQDLAEELPASLVEQVLPSCAW